MGRPVTFVGAADVPHCSPMTRAQGVPNVRVNSIAVSCQGHLNTVHDMPNPSTPPPLCIPHTGQIVTGSLKVRVTGLGIGRVGDVVAEIRPPPLPSRPCTAVAEGSPNVLAG